MPNYTVIIPIAGHAYIDVEAANGEEAKEKAFEDVQLKDIQEWETLHRFNQGNVCYCPQPWQVEVEENR